MARRRESFLDALIYLPWWVGVLVGVFGYGAIAVIGPAILGTPYSSGPTFHLPRLIGYCFLILCLVGAGCSALRALLLRRKLEQQRSIEAVKDFLDTRLQVIRFSQAANLVLAA